VLAAVANPLAKHIPVNTAAARKNHLTTGILMFHPWNNGRHIRRVKHVENAIAINPLQLS